MEALVEKGPDKRPQRIGLDIGSGIEAPSDEVPGGAARPMSINP